MFLILKNTDWKEEDYVNNNIIPTISITLITPVFSLCKRVKSPYNIVRIVDLIIQALRA